MRAKEGFVLRTIAGEKIIVAEGKQNIDYGNIISMNESAAYLWEAIQGKDFTAEDLAKLLTDEYDVDEETALKDSESIIKSWLETEIVEE